MSAKAPAKGHTTKHTAGSKPKAKHATSAGKSGTKHTPAKQKAPATAKSKAPAKVHTKAQHAKPAKAAGFAIGDLLPVCSAQALAQSLRLAGQRVTDDEVLELHHLAGGTMDEAAHVGHVLAAAALSGLSGCRPRTPEITWTQVWQLESIGKVALWGQALEAFFDQGHRPVEPLVDEAFVHGLILQIDVPGPHAVLATADGWWSWGELYSPWPARVEAAWAVSWS